MKTSTRAALLSALVFPGAGHLYLKKYPVGIGLLVISVGLLYVVLTGVVDEAVAISEQLQSGAVPASAASISALLEQTQAVQTDALNLASTALLVCWLAGIVDAYRLGMRRDRQLAGSGRS